MAATCVLCGASNPIARVYRGLFTSKPNLVGISCRECGQVSSQLRTLPEYVGFALIYSAITLLLLLIGVRVLSGRLTEGWIAAIAATMPWAVLPAWWSSRQAPELAELAPRQDLSTGRKLLYGGVAVALIGGVVGAGMFAYLMVQA